MHLLSDDRRPDNSNIETYQSVNGHPTKGHYRPTDPQRYINRPPDPRGPGMAGYLPGLPHQPASRPPRCTNFPRITDNSREWMLVIDFYRTFVSEFCFYLGIIRVKRCGLDLTFATKWVMQLLGWTFFWLRCQLKLRLWPKSVWHKSWPRGMEMSGLPSLARSIDIPVTCTWTKATNVTFLELCAALKSSLLSLNHHGLVRHKPLLQTKTNGISRSQCNFSLVHGSYRITGKNDSSG